MKTSPPPTRSSQSNPVLYIQKDTQSLWRYKGLRSSTSGTRTKIKQCKKDVLITPSLSFTRVYKLRARNLGWRPNRDVLGHPDLHEHAYSAGVVSECLHPSRCPLESPHLCLVVDFSMWSGQQETGGQGPPWWSTG